jgi:glycosyltransferase involved in cell wall biosynthesis
MVVSEGLGNLVAVRSGVRTSCICLTPLKIAYDEVTRRRYFELGGGLQQRLATAIYARLEKPVWARYERVFCNSSETRRRLLAHALVDESRLEVVHHGVDTSFFVPADDHEPYFLVAGRIMWSKNIELAIDAWRLFKPEPAASRHSLVIAGMVDEKSQGYLRSLKGLAAGRPDISFVESPSDAELLSLYQRCHAVVFTPPNEDWGLVPLEAMACARPVLATARGGPLESVIDGETGFLCEDTPLAFADGIRRLAAVDERQLEVMGLMARKRALAFTWDRFVDRIDQHVEELG